MFVDFDMREQQGIYQKKCYYGLWISILARRDGVHLKHHDNGFVSHKNSALNTFSFMGELFL